jgi:hypothetical protein
MGKGCQPQSEERTESNMASPKGIRAHPFVRLTVPSLVEGRNFESGSTSCTDVGLPVFLALGDRDSLQSPGTERERGP